ncbi:serine hydrolase [candidate division KSB1 bacterium]|nr:serine hydrolase [candidate division KSB1 bacterium]
MKTRSILLIIFMTVFSIQAKSGPLPKKLDDYVLRVMKTFQVPGVGLAVVKDGQILLAKGYGVRTLGADDPVDERTLFGIASNTKAFTATALALLVEEDKLKWDDPVINYLPYFQMYDPYVTRELTIRDLLVHRSGLGLGAGDLLWWPETTLDRKEIVRRLRYIKPASSFRSKYAYDNVLYSVAGEVIEAVSGQTWETFVDNRIIKPVGMLDSKVRHSDSGMGGNVAMPHAVIEGELKPVTPFVSDNVNPAGGINASATDMAKWVIVQLDSGRLADGTRLFSQNTTRQLWALVTPRFPGKPPAELAPLESNFRGYALGFGVQDYRGIKIVHHTGGLPGYVSKVTMVPEIKLGIVVLTNQESGEAFDVMTLHIMDHFLKAKPYDWLNGYVKVKARSDSMVSAEKETRELERNTSSQPSLPLEKYAGTYKDPWYGTMVLSLKKDRLLLQFSNTPSLVGDLEHWQYDTFIVRWHDRELRADAFVTFALHPDGSIDQVKMAPVSSATDFSFDFKDLLFKPVQD